MVKVIWTDSAIQDLNDIGDFISKDSIRYAEITVDKLFNAVEILIANPLIGRIVPEFDDENIRELIRGNYRIVYLFVDEFRIDILTVNNCARLIENSNFSKEDRTS